MTLHTAKHIWYYSTLSIILLAGLALVVLLAPHKQYQIIAVMLIAFFYMVWSILHQYLHHHLTSKIVIEYVLIGSLGIVLSLFLFNL